MKYLNTRTSEGIETIDHIDRNDFNTYSDYSKEVKRLVREYRICGINVYTSQRSTKGYYGGALWNSRNNIKNKTTI